MEEAPLPEPPAAEPTMTEPPVSPAPADSPLPTEASPGRLPWAVVVLEGRSLVLGLLGVTLFAGDALRWWVLGLGLLFVGRLVRLRLTRWWLSDESFVIQQGLIFRSRRVISRARIQAVDLERGLLHRLLGLTEVRVEALGAASTEGALPGIRPDQASALRAELLLRPRSREATGDPGFARGGLLHEEDAAGTEAWADAGEDASQGAVVFRLPGGEVVVAGLTESRLGAGLALVGVGFEAVRQGAFSGWFGDPESWAPAVEALPWVALMVGFVILVFLFSLALSFVLTVLGYWGFTLRRRGDVLAVERGLLTQHRDTVPLRRIQAVRVEENPFRRLMGLASVKVVVGGRVNVGNRRSGTNVLLPVGTRERAFALAAEVAGWTTPADPGPEDPAEAPAEISHPVPALNPMPPQARARRRFRALLAAIVVGLLAPVFRHGMSALLPWSWTGAHVGLAVAAGLVTLLVGVALAEGAWRGLGWAFLGSHVAFREGILERVTTLVPLARLQSVEVVANPFQRRRGLATLLIPVARPPLEMDPRGLDLSAEQADALRDRILGATRPPRSRDGSGGGRRNGGALPGDTPLTPPPAPPSPPQATPMGAVE
jgi:putative membrane protein